MSDTTHFDRNRNGRKPNPFSAAGAKRSSPRALFLTLTKGGKLVAGPDKTPVTETQFLVDVEAAQEGFTVFAGGRLLDERMALIALDEPVDPYQLPDHSPNSWIPTLAVPLRSVESGIEYILKQHSQGGLDAIRGLLAEYGSRVDAGKSGAPIVAIGVGSRESRRFGTLYYPVFRVVGFDVANPEDGLRDDEITL